MNTGRTPERLERSVSHVWTRRALVMAGLVLIGWLFLSGSPAEAAAVPNDPAGTGLAAAGATEASALTSASGSSKAGSSKPSSNKPSGMGIAEPPAARVTDEVREYGGRAQRSHMLEQVANARQHSGGVADDLDDTVGTVDNHVERAGQVTHVVRPDTTPALGAGADMAPPVFEPAGKVITATPGEPSVPSEGNPEAPGSSVEAPRASTESGTESLAAAADSARPSSGSSPTPRSSGRTSGGSGTRADLGPPMPPRPVLPVPGPSHDAPDGTVSTASGHGSVDRAQNVSSDTSPLVLEPRLLASRPVASRSTGHPERATGPSVSPD